MTKSNNEESSNTIKDGGTKNSNANNNNKMTTPKAKLPGIISRGTSSSSTNNSNPSSQTKSRSLSPKKAWWLQSTSELEEVKQKQRQRQSQLHKPDISEALLDALGSQKSIEELDESEGDLDLDNAILLEGLIPSSTSKSNKPRGSGSRGKGDGDDDDDDDAGAASSVVTAAANTATSTSTSTATATTTSQVTAPKRVMRRGKTIESQQPTRRKTTSSASTTATSSTVSSASSNEEKKKGPPKRTCSFTLGKQISTEEIEQIIEQEKRAKHVFAVEWGVGEADEFVKQLQEKGRLWDLTITNNSNTSTTNTNTNTNTITITNKSALRPSMSWKDLEQRMQQSAIQKAKIEEFRKLPKLKQAAFTLVLSQLLSSKERQDLYELYNSNNNNNTNNNKNNKNDNNDTTITDTTIIKSKGSTTDKTNTNNDKLVMDYTEFMVGAAIASDHNHDNKSSSTAKHRLEMLSGESLRKAFTIFDNEGKGFISKDNLIHLCKHQDDTTRRIIQDVAASNENDTDSNNNDDGNNNLSFADFVSLFFGDEEMVGDLPSTNTDDDNDNCDREKVITTSTSTSSQKSYKKDKTKKKSAKKNKKKGKNKKEKSKKKSSKNNKKGKKQRDKTDEIGMDFDDVSIDESVKTNDLHGNGSISSEGGEEYGVDDISIDTMSDTSSSTADDNDDDSSSAHADDNRNHNTSPTSNPDKKKRNNNKASVFDWKSHSKTRTRPALKVQNIMADKKAKDDRIANSKPASSVTQPMPPAATIHIEEKGPPATPSSVATSETGTMPDLPKSPENSSARKNDFPTGDAPRSPQRDKVKKLTVPIASALAVDATVANKNTSATSSKIAATEKAVTATPTGNAPSRTTSAPARSAAPESTTSPMKAITHAPTESPKPQIPPNAPRKVASTPSSTKTALSTLTRTHLPLNTPRSVGKVWPTVNSNRPTAPLPSTSISTSPPVRNDPVDKRRQDLGLASAKRKGQPPGAVGPKLSKGFMWELKTAQQDLSRKLKPVIRNKKTERKKVVDPDQPYMEELKEVQAEVLPVWRRETYSFWL